MNEKEKFLFLHKYSDWLAKSGYLDDDWWTEEENAVTRFLKETNSRDYEK